MTMAGADRASSLRRRFRCGELALRMCSALVLAPLAIGIAYVGGWLFAVFGGWQPVSLWEWTPWWREAIGGRFCR